MARFTDIYFRTYLAFSKIRKTFELRQVNSLKGDAFDQIRSKPSLEKSEVCKNTL